MNVIDFVLNNEKPTIIPAGLVQVDQILKNHWPQFATSHRNNIDGFKIIRFAVAFDGKYDKEYLTELSHALADYITISPQYKVLCIFEGLQNSPVNSISLLTQMLRKMKKTYSNAYFLLPTSVNLNTNKQTEAEKTIAINSAVYTLSELNIKYLIEENLKFLFNKLPNLPMHLWESIEVPEIEQNEVNIKSGVKGSANTNSSPPQEAATEISAVKKPRVRKPKV